jgi:hypothetical protein
MPSHFAVEKVATQIMSQSIMAVSFRQEKSYLRLKHTQICGYLKSL